jgi:tetratricopeptide (TPR) repeat protein
VVGAARPLTGQGPLLRELAGRARPGSAGWCAAHLWLAWAAFGSADLPQALQRSAAVIEATGGREPSRLLADCLTVQSETLANLGRVPEAAEHGRRAPALARELDYLFGIARAMACLVLAALYAGDLDEAAQLARQAGKIPDVPASAGRLCGFLLAAALAEAGDLPGAGQAGAATLAWARDAGDAYSLDGLLTVMAGLDLRAGRADDAAGHLHEAVRLMLSSGEWFMMMAVLDRCGQLCAATGRPADAVTAWAAMETSCSKAGGKTPTTQTHAGGRTPCARPDGCSAPAAPAPPSSAGKR